jgi:hypothetical protein
MRRRIVESRMKNFPMTSVVARRTLDYRPDGGPSRKVRVDVGQPARASMGHDWYCPYRIVGLGKNGIRRAYGVDALQALILALASLSRELTEQGKNEPALTWLGDRWLGLKVHCVMHADSQHMLDDIKRRGKKLPSDIRRRLGRGEARTSIN